MRFYIAFGIIPNYCTAIFFSVLQTILKKSTLQLLFFLRYEKSWKTFVHIVHFVTNQKADLSPTIQSL